MIYRRSFIAFDALYLFIFMAACNSVTTAPRHETEPPTVIAVLSNDLVYVGSTSAEEAEPTSHGSEAAPLPARYQVGQQYVFHHRTGVDNDKLVEILLKALRAQGVVPQEVHRVGYRYIGGLAFRIRLLDQGYTLRFFNILDNRIVTDNALITEWAVDDYIVVVEDGPRD